MRSSIKGYLTGLINNYKNGIGFKVNPMTNTCNALIVDILNDLLDYVTKFKEETVSEKTVIENEILKKRIVELEESCENMNEVEKNNHATIATLESNTTWIRTQLLNSDKTLREVEELNIGLRKTNQYASSLNKQYLRKIRTLRSKLNNKLRGAC